MEEENLLKERETFGSRLGFILVSAGCAVGLGNVWKFPYMTGKYGGAAFILIYLGFLVLLGLPILVSEFAVGRSSRLSTARAFHKLEPEGSNFHKYSYMGMIGNYMLMMFYTMVDRTVALPDKDCTDDQLIDPISDIRQSQRRITPQILVFKMKQFIKLHQIRFHFTPSRVSFSSMPFSRSSPRISSALAKSLAFLAA